MRIFKRVFHTKMNAFVKKLERATILEVQGQIKKKWIPFIWVTRITYMYSLYLTIVMVIINVVYMFIAGISVKIFTVVSTLFFHLICEKQEITLS